MKKVFPSPFRHPVIEISLEGRDLSEKNKESARTFFRRCRISEENLVVSDYKGAFRLYCYLYSSKRASEICRRYRDLKTPAFKLKVKKLQRKDWFDKWKKDYHARAIGSKFMIVPIWERKKFKSKYRIPVFLEPGSAFGSGYHETTRLMARLLEFLEGKARSFLDIGCGTGILSVIASQLGVSKITGFDNDRPSVIVAGENFRSNKCENGTFLRAQLKSSGITGRFDAVGANLLSRTLLEHRRQIIARVREGGYLLISGVAIQNLVSFRKEFSGRGLRCLKVLRGRKWVAFLYKKI